jgi:hypothetical protein
MGTSEARLSVGSGPERPAATKEQQEREEQRTCETWPIRAGPQSSARRRRVTTWRSQPRWTEQKLSGL